MTTAAENREATLKSLTDLVGYFNPNDPIQRAHYLALAKEFGQMWAAMLVSQDVAFHGPSELELTDPGEINTWVGWTKLNRVVRHGEQADYTAFDFEANTKIGGRVVKMFTRDQTVPAYEQPE